MVIQVFHWSRPAGDCICGESGAMFTWSDVVSRPVGESW